MKNQRDENFILERSSELEHKWQILSFEFLDEGKQTKQLHFFQMEF